MVRNRENRIGIIGGMGAAASSLFYKYVTDMTDASVDQEHVNLMILSDASMPDRTRAILSGDYEQAEEQLLDDALTLQNCGCVAIGVTCNTSHFFIDRIEQKVDVPFIHMIDETAAAVAARKESGRTAVLATDGTIQTGLYQERLKKYGVEPFVPEDKMQQLVMYEIYDRIKKGLPCDREAWERLDNYIRMQNCVNAILACTELSVIRDEILLGDFYVDPMRILAKKVIQLGGKKLKSE